MTKISVACGQCRAQLQAPTALAGKSAVCPKCKSMIAIPTPQPPALSSVGNSATHNANPWDVPLDLPRSLPSSPRPTHSAGGALNTPLIVLGSLAVLTLVVTGTVLITRSVEHNRSAGGGGVTVSSDVPAELQPGPNNQVFIEYMDMTIGGQAILEVSHIYKAEPGMAIVANKAGDKIVVNGSYRLYTKNSPIETNAAGVPRLGPKYPW